MAKAQSVKDYLDALDHARLADVLAVRQVILAADPDISEQVKWNAPSFSWDGDDRITMRLHPGDRLDLIFHRGAKPKDSAGFSFSDPSGRLAWAAPDRGVFRVGDPARDATVLTALVLAWQTATRLAR